MATSSARVLPATEHPARPDKYQRRRFSPGDKPKAILYLRVSQTKGRVGRDDYHSEAQQLRDCKACAAQHGFEVADIIIDRDKSGGEIERLLPIVERIESGDADVLVVFKTSRFARRAMAQYEITVRLLECGGDLVAAREHYDVYSHQGRMMLNLLLQIAEAELETAKDYWWDIHVLNITAGISNGPAPFGYRRKRLNPETGKRSGPFEPDPENDRAKIARQVFLKRGAGWGWGKIARWLNSNGHTNRQGNPFNQSSLRSMIKNRAYRGEVKFGEHLKNSEAHEPLVSEEEWQRAQAATSTTPARTKRKDGGYLLSSLVRCPYCRYAMQGHSVGVSKRKVYRCQSSPNGLQARNCPCPPTIKAKSLEEYVEKEIIGWARQQNIKAVQLEDEDDLATELRDQVSIWEHRVEVWMSDPENLDDQARFIRQRDLLRSELKKARRALADHTSRYKASGIEDDILDRWEAGKLLPQDRRQLLSSVIGAIFVLRKEPGTAPTAPVDARVFIVSPEDLPARLPRRGVKDMVNPGPLPGIKLPDGSIAPRDPDDWAA